MIALFEHKGDDDFLETDVFSLHGVGKFLDATDQFLN